MGGSGRAQIMGWVRVVFLGKQLVMNCSGSMSVFKKKIFFLMLIYFRDRPHKWGRGRESRRQNLKQAAGSSQHRA